MSKPIDRHDVYPRPDFQRSDLRWTMLNGAWKFGFDDNDVGRDERWNFGVPVEAVREIQVPFTFQTPASGINERAVHEVLWYERDFTDIRPPAERSRKTRLLVRFGAVDYEATVWVNGVYLGGHVGGHVPFDIDVTDVLDSTEPEKTYKIVVRVFDSATDLTQPRGKQYWKPESESIFYAPTSGIWQSVWLEAVPALRIGDGSYGTILRQDDIASGTLHATIAVVGRRVAQKCSLQVEASYLGHVVSATDPIEVPQDKSYARLGLNLRLNATQLAEAVAEHQDATQWLEGLALWSPEHPHLYDINIRLFGESNELIDAVNTYVGMRKLDWQSEDRTWQLNGRPYFQMLVLDQGYWPDTGLTPPSAVALRTDIELTKALGFNGCRKHQKVEDPMFLYWADKLGFLVWGEMASAYDFDEAYVERFNAEWLAMVRRDLNHPSIVAWTPANESWGYPDLQNSIEQRNHLRSLYYVTKTLDPTRPINDNCGWEHVATDLTTFHDYSDAPGLAKACAAWDGILAPKSGRAIFVSALPAAHDPGALPSPRAPIVCTEFGGVNIRAGAAAGAKDWGYTTAQDAEDLLARVERLVNAVVEGGWCCGLVYTQLTDIEQEVNGLFTPKREAKLDTARLRAIMERARDRYHELRAETAKQGVTDTE